MPSVMKNGLPLMFYNLILYPRLDCTQRTPVLRPACSPHLQAVSLSRVAPGHDDNVLPLPPRVHRRPHVLHSLCAADHLLVPHVPTGLGRHLQQQGLRPFD